MVAEKPAAAPPRDSYTYMPNTQSVPFFAGPRVLNRPHSITATVDIPDGGCRRRAAVPRHRGRRLLAVHQGRQAALRPQLRRAQPAPRLLPGPDPAGAHELRFEFEPTGQPDLPNGRGAPGRLQLYVDRQLVADAEAPVTTPFALNPGALTCGANPGSPVTPDYPSPFRFTGTLHTVTVDVSGELIIDTESEMRMAMARQ